MDTRIKPCEICEGEIGPTFFIVKLGYALVDYSAVNRFAGLPQSFQEHQSVAEVFATNQTLEVLVSGDDANEWPEMVICQECCFSNDLSRKLFEKASDDWEET